MAKDEKSRFDRLLERFTGGNTAKAALPTTQRGLGSSLFDNWGPSGGASRSSGDGAEDNIIIARAVAIISSTLASVPVHLYRGETEVMSGPLADLLQNPNHLEAWPRFCRSIATLALVDGQAFAVLGDPARSTGVPVDMLPVSSGEVKPVRPDGSPYDLRGWEIDGYGTPLDPEQVIRFEYMPDPSDPLGAISPLGAASSDIEADELAAAFNRYALESGGAVAGILNWTNPDVRLTEADLDRASKSFEEKYSGAQNANTTAVLSGDWNYQSLGQNSKDLEYIEGRKFIQQRLSLIYGIPPVLLGDYSNSGLSTAGLTIARRLLYENAIIPFARNMQAVLTKALCKKGEEIRFDFDGVEALRDDYTEKLTQAGLLAALGYPVNMLNETLRLGLPDVPWGDEALVNAGLTTAESITVAAEAVEEVAAEIESDVPMLDASQMSTAIALVEKVQSGALPKDSAKAAMTQLLGLTPEQAEALLGSAGPKPEPEPVVVPDADPEEVRSAAGNFTSTRMASLASVTIEKMGKG